MASEPQHIAAPPVVSVVIVTYNTRDMTLECLRTLEVALNGLSSEIVVVDNASADGTTEAIRATFSKVRLIRNERNGGFGAANNQGMAVARGEFFLLLNSDAFPEPNAITALVQFMRMNPRTAVAGPRIHNHDGSLQVSCYKFPDPIHAWMENLWLTRGYGRWAHDTVREVDFVIGACMLVRREAFAEVGGFDEKFFMYSEEADWQYRMQNHGWKVAFAPSARVIHLGGASGASEKAAINRYFFQSLDYYERKHHGLVGLISMRCAMAVGCFMRAFLWSAASLWPHQRQVALSKARLHSWLMLRQTLHWR